MTQISKDAVRLGLDLDGVIVDHADIKLKLAKERGFLIKRGDTSSDIFRKIIPKETREEIQDILYNKRSDQPLVMGAKMALQQIKKAGIPIFLISRRRAGRAREKALEIIKNNGLWVEIFNEDNVNFVESPEEKNEVAKRLGITHYFDDEDKVLDVMVDVPNRFIFDQFDNFKNHPRHGRVGGWEELKNKIL